jgi:hypothetical protein
MEENKDIFDYLKVNKIGGPDASYFENLANSVIEKSQSNTPIIPLYRKPITWISAAAASIAILLLVNLFNQPDEPGNVLLALNDIPSNEIEAYVSENIDDFDTELIVEYIDEESLITQEKEDKQEIEVEKTIDFEEITAKDILDYFDHEEIELEELQDEESFI